MSTSMEKNEKGGTKMFIFYPWLGLIGAKSRISPIHACYIYSAWVCAKHIDNPLN